MKRRALFVGVDKYADKTIHPLGFAANDAAELAGFFKHCARFDRAEPLIEPRTCEEVFTAIRDMLGGLSAGDEFLFFFAGHGIKTPDGLRFVCADDKLSAVKHAWAGIPLERLKFETAGAFNRLFLFDACRTDVLATNRGGSCAQEKGMRDLILEDACPADSQRGALTILCSCDDNQCAGESAQLRHGLFSKAFLDLLDEGHRNGRCVSVDDNFVYTQLPDRMSELAVAAGMTCQQAPQKSGPSVLILNAVVASAPPHLAPVPPPSMDVDIYLVEAEAKDIFERKVVKAAEPSDASQESLFRRLRLLYSAVSSALLRGDTAAARKLYADFTQSVATYETAAVEAVRKTEAARGTKTASEVFAHLIQSVFSYETPVVEAVRQAEAARRAEQTRAREAEAARLSGVGVKAGDVQEMELPGGAKMKFVWCPPGTFTMGSPSYEEGRSDVETQHRVTLTKGFWLGQYEVTQAQWRSVMGNNPSECKGDDRPVETVSWYDCQAFVAKCNAATKGVTFALPTEAQWEYACRAGTTTPFSFGTALNGNQANCNGNYPCGTTKKGPYRAETAPVGSYAPNAWNLYDMHGNVWEWCADWYGAYKGDCTDPTGPASGLRGGSWLNDARACRSAARIRDGPWNRNYYFGFRLLCSAGPHE